MIRVLLLSNMYPSKRWPIYGPFVKAHEKALLATGQIEITRVAITDPRKGWRIPLKYAGFLIRACFVSLIRRFDVVHVHYAHPTALAAIIAKWRGAKVVITAHGGDVNEKLLGGGTGARRSFLRADHIIAVSTDLEAKIRNEMKGLCPPVSVQNMGVDGKLFSEGDARDRTKPAEPARLLFVGQLIARKGPDTLIEELAGVSVPWTLRIVGDGPLRASLEERSQALGLVDRIEFLGLREQRELPAQFRDADLFIGPSRQEPLGLVFLEAAACGCPVIGTAVGGIPEIHTDGESALLVAPDDPGVLAAAITRALTDADLRARLIRGGREAAERDSLTASVEHTLSVYRQLLGHAS